MLLLSTVLLYMSTGTYTAALIWNSSAWNHVVVKATDSFFSQSFDGPREIARFQDLVRRQSWMLTVSTVINVSISQSMRKARLSHLTPKFIVGDAIVWWRACAIWQNNVVYCIGPLLVTLTLRESPSLASSFRRLMSPLSSALLESTSRHLEAHRRQCSVY